MVGRAAFFSPNGSARGLDQKKALLVMPVDTSPALHIACLNSLCTLVDEGKMSAADSVSHLVPLVHALPPWSVMDNDYFFRVCARLHLLSCLDRGTPLLNYDALPSMSLLDLQKTAATYTSHPMVVLIRVGGLQALSAVLGSIDVAVSRCRSEERAKLVNLVVSGVFVPLLASILYHTPSPSSSSGPSPMLFVDDHLLVQGLSPFPSCYIYSVFKSMAASFSCVLRTRLWLPLTHLFFFRSLLALHMLSC